MEKGCPGPTPSILDLFVISCTSCMKGMLECSWVYIVSVAVEPSSIHLGPSVFSSANGEMRGTVRRFRDNACETLGLQGAIDGNSPYNLLKCRMGAQCQALTALSGDGGVGDRKGT